MGGTCVMVAQREEIHGRQSRASYEDDGPECVYSGPDQTVATAGAEEADAGSAVAGAGGGANERGMVESLSHGRQGRCHRRGLLAAALTGAEDGDLPSRS